MHGISEHNTEAMRYAEQGHISAQLFISAMLVVNALQVSAENIHFPSLWPSLSLSLPKLSASRDQATFSVWLNISSTPQILCSLQSLSISVTHTVTLQRLLEN